MTTEAFRAKLLGAVGNLGERRLELLMRMIPGSEEKTSGADELLVDTVEQFEQLGVSENQVLDVLREGEDLGAIRTQIVIAVGAIRKAVRNRKILV